MRVAPLNIASGHDLLHRRSDLLLEASVERPLFLVEVAWDNLNRALGELDKRLAVEDVGLPPTKHNCAQDDLAIYIYQNANEMEEL